ncbi:MAG: hypothetical protein J0H43_12230 [Actinobacteria bacterium]|nr:hypothetical protein [Actinomycetota bacterium]
MSIEPAGHLKIVDSVSGGTGQYAAVRLYAYTVGTVTLTVRHDGTLVSATRISIVAP